MDGTGDDYFKSSKSDSERQKGHFFLNEENASDLNVESGLKFIRKSFKRKKKEAGVRKKEARANVMFSYTYTI